MNNVYDSLPDSLIPPYTPIIPVKPKSKTGYYVIGGITVLLLIILVGITYYMMSSESLLFTPYTRPADPKLYQPFGATVKLTATQIHNRKVRICQAFTRLSQGTSSAASAAAAELIANGCSNYTTLI